MPLPITIMCSHCGNSQQVPQYEAGKKVRCVVCGHVLLVPRSEKPGNVELTESGDRVYRYSPRERGFQLAHGKCESIKAISDHIEKHLAPIADVYHEILSDIVHVDVYHVAPSDDRPWHSLVSGGMSDLPMSVPDGVHGLAHLELMVSLPPHWPLNQESFENEDTYWPIRWLKILARFPHENPTWLGNGHTIPNGDPPEPFAPGTKLCCWLLAPSITAPEGFGHLTITKKTITFLAMVPLYREEMEFKLKHGCDALLEKFDRMGIGAVLDSSRLNVCQKRGKGR
jgi:hypothetical protein